MRTRGSFCVVSSTVFAAMMRLMLILSMTTAAFVTGFILPAPCATVRPKGALCLASPQFSSDDEAGIRRRLQDVAASDMEEAQMAATGSANLPVVAFDALLPSQRLQGSTTDPTFSRFLCELGLGGLFMMTSMNYRRRQLRRSGVLARIEFVDVERAGSGGPLDPTEVSFAVVGRRRCRMIGPPKDMAARVGRWRRSYDADGEEVLLGWGKERFVDARNHTSTKTSIAAATGASESIEPLLHTVWSPCAVDCGLDEDESEAADGELTQRAEGLLALLDRWLALASDPRTYNNLDVVAGVRQERGQAGLRVDPARLLEEVRAQLGPRPPPTQPTALAFWGAALINPLPPLGVSVEIRGAMLEAATPQERLTVLERGLVRSIWNLDGSAPLSPY